ncbi:nucleoside-diphosphate-sugar epimerase [Rhypophila decipiens]|uniref:Nucleoside-diphosphate-sugar epimerase n=1 Tax=Rhypophila decipiens TaxID=261697 RepID=A0AAN6XY86_9PEZI|nr:nucleoside-diphosphate-sugar epimerase [Rhypophila decipiens]
MHLILTGATGLVGSGVLDVMIKMKDVTKISILSRRPVQMAEDVKDPRVNVILHQDFNQYPKELLDQLKDAEGCVWALGISQTKVNAEDYTKITKDYALNFCRAFQQAHSQSNKPFNFVYVSGYGSTFTPRFWTPFYGKVKGETELELAAMRRENSLFKSMTARPNVIDPHQHPEILPYLPSDTPAMKPSLGLIVKFASQCAKWAHSPTQPLGKVLTELAMGRLDGQIEKEVGEKKGGVERLDGRFVVLENSALRRLAGLD